MKPILGARWAPSWFERRASDGRYEACMPRWTLTRSCCSGASCPAGYAPAGLGAQRPVGRGLVLLWGLCS